jgi:RNA polymerase sigma-70 factor (ECF subfamily)
VEDDYLINMNRIDPCVIDSLVIKYWKDIWNFAFGLTNSRNQVINYKRSAFFRRMIPVSVVKSSAESASAESVFFAGAFIDDVWQHLLTLPCKYREILVLEIRYGLSIAEVADFLSIAEGTVKSRLHRARVKMRKKMQEERT